MQKLSYAHPQKQILSTLLVSSYMEVIRFFTCETQNQDTDSVACNQQNRFLGQVVFPCIAVHGGWMNVRMWEKLETDGDISSDYVIDATCAGGKSDEMAISCCMLNREPFIN